MNQKLRVLLFGTLLLGAFLLAGSLSSQVFAAPVHNSTPSFSRPFPDVFNYNRGYRDGFSQGYRDGLQACAEHHYREYQQPHSFLHLTAYTRGYADGYAAGYERGLHSCYGYPYHQPYENHHDAGEQHHQLPDIHTAISK
jgi:hypothetical protein